MSVADKLLQIDQVKQDIKQAIEDKGVAMSGVPFVNYPLKINEISGGGSGHGDTLEIALNVFSLSDASTNDLKLAWEHSLTVDPAEITRKSSLSTQYGKLQYPNGEDNGVIIPDSVTSIGNDAFYNWTSNNQPLVIPDSVTSIGEKAFQNWTSNNQPLVIPNSVKSIGINAFSNWSSNNQPLVIPNSVTSIGSTAFKNWSLLPYVEIQAITPPTLGGSNAFDKQNNAPIYVPDANVDAYKMATNWVDLASRIRAVSEKS